MNKVTYQFAAVVDICPNVIAEYKGEHKQIRVPEYKPMAMAFADASAFLNALEKEVRKAFNIEGFIDLEDVTPELPLPTGPHEGAIGFGSHGAYDYED